jgi:hypothetical protein
MPVGNTTDIPSMGVAAGLRNTCVLNGLRRRDVRFEHTGGHVVGSLIRSWIVT